MKVSVQKEELDVLEAQASAFLAENKEAIISVEASDAKTEFATLLADIDKLKVDIETTKVLGIDTTVATLDMDLVGTKVLEIKSSAETPTVLNIDGTQAIIQTDAVVQNIDNKAPVIKVGAETTELDTAKTKTEELNTANPIVTVSADGSEVAGIADNIASLSLITPIVSIQFDSKSITSAKKEITSLNTIKTQSTHKVDTNDVNRAKLSINYLKSINTQTTHFISDNVATVAQAIWSLNGLNTFSVHTVRYQYVGKAQTGGLMQTPKQLFGSAIPRFNVGGHLDSGLGHSRKTGMLGGYGGGDRIKALLEAGEFIINKSAVRKLGLDRMNMINQGMLPRFNTGGIVDSVDTVNNAMSEGVTDSSISSSGNIVDLNFNIGGNSYKAFADEDVANQLAEFLLRSEM